MKTINCGSVSLGWTSLGSTATATINISTILSSNGIKASDITVNNFAFTINSMSGAFWGKESNWKNINVNYGYNNGVVAVSRTSVSNSDTSMEINFSVNIKLFVV